MPLKNQVLILDFVKKSEQMLMKEDFLACFMTDFFKDHQWSLISY